MPFRYSEMSEVEVKIACPVCRGCCDCKTCSHIGAKDGGCKVGLFSNFFTFSWGKIL